MFFPPAQAPVDDAGDSEDFATTRLDLRVVVVEDNPDVASAILPVLEAQGCEVTAFAASTDAIAWIDAHPTEVDLVLTDVVMAGPLDGLHLAQHMRRTRPNIALVVMTGYAEQLEAITGQGFTVLAKPWTAETLARVLRVGKAAAPSPA
jgi:CheY-like chemotaxis protein